MTATFAAPCECCSIRQDVKWDKVAADYFTNNLGNAGVLHTGYPPNTPHDEWIEDRNVRGDKYGYRKPNSDEYSPDGCSYESNDEPRLPEDGKGQWQYRLRVVDSGENTIATSAVITVNW